MIGSISIHNEIYQKIYRFERKRNTYLKHLIVSSILFFGIGILGIFFDHKILAAAFYLELIFFVWMMACIKNLITLKTNQYIKELNILLKQGKDKPDIDEILKRNKKILEIIERILKNHNPKTSSRTIYKMEFEYLIAMVTDLRSDLQLRLEEQQKTLEQAKSEVEQNIHGTSELNQVSELQRARLDQQIEQFEELQRVLVKV